MTWASEVQQRKREALKRERGLKGLDKRERDFIRFKKERERP